MQSGHGKKLNFYWSDFEVLASRTQLLAFSADVRTYIFCSWHVDAPTLSHRSNLRVSD